MTAYNPINEHIKFFFGAFRLLSSISRSLLNSRSRLLSYIITFFPFLLLLNIVFIAPKIHVEKIIIAPPLRFSQFSLFFFFLFTRLGFNISMQIANPFIALRKFHCNTPIKHLNIIKTIFVLSFFLMCMFYILLHVIAQHTLKSTLRKLFRGVCVLYFILYFPGEIE